MTSCTPLKIDLISSLRSSSGTGPPFAILVRQPFLCVGILEDHDLLGIHELLTCIHLRICSILPHAVQLGVRTPILATTNRDCAGPSGVRCDTAAIRAPAVVVLVHALDNAGAFILLLGRLLLLMPTILMPTILMPIILLLLMPTGLVRSKGASMYGSRALRNSFRSCGDRSPSGLAQMGRRRCA